ncbi:MAG: cysteine desulfurase [Alphaproteobacteria bacterium]|nr:cysteine desulfurase [Alphaproteobacteria bacterium]OUT41931.1 MAG: cysteine desulfurase [Micavibrio sp. TMED2]HCK19792.1 cysteine desulfurase [Thalassospira sp.]MAS46474.1 cysteine desulfurase [Alphaproteobacteria bacterium]MAX94568.1 cysteine desulfurase [Alphaproteobacteria bacterium]|tara:strand:+ start:2311 stop:3429 length:1119 start_codon:yes stop_codon:yes gene_type:complete
MPEPIYLDHNATTPIKPGVAAAMANAIRLTGNPSSIHSFGREARKHLEIARHQVAAAINAEPEDVIFTSGATEADNAALRHAGAATVIISAVEHPAILQARDDAVRVPVDENGVLDLAALVAALQSAKAPALVSIMLANNETGVIQPVAEIAKLAKQYDAWFHCDAAQGLGKIPVDVRAIGADLLSLSAHKCGGPAGVGALITSARLEPAKWQFGGGQEKRRRPGTENLVGAVGFGLAAELAVQDLPAFAELAALRDGMEQAVLRDVPAVRVMGGGVDRLPNTASLVLPGVPAQTQVMALDLAGYAVSSGSACSSGKVDPSHVIEAMTGDPAVSACALRISLGWCTTPGEVAGFTDAYIRMAKRQLEKLSAA